MHNPFHFLLLRLPYKNKLSFLPSAFCLLLSAFSLLHPAFCQSPSPPPSLSIVFYNVENLFDPAKDPEKNDDAFTPTGFNRWTYKRFYKKINDIAKVFLTITGWEPPALIGLAEIENANVLQKLCNATGLKSYHYTYVHYDSPDPRGIDVALLYREDRITILESFPIPVVFPFEPHKKNRDILYAKALFGGDRLSHIPADTLHLFVNHWTSRFGGAGATIPKRNYYAQVLRAKVDSVLIINPNAYIIIMGDFNDYPTDESLTTYLQAKNYKNESNSGTLFNLMAPLVAESRKQKAEDRKETLFLKAPLVAGTHKTQEFWGCLDQIIVSKSLLDKQSKWQIENGTAIIFDAPFLLVPDEKYGGVKPFRTYLGPKYLGGYSDHLPVGVVVTRE